MDYFNETAQSLRHKLSAKRERVLTRYEYYEMKNHVRDFQISTPDKLQHWQAVLGWCAKGVDALADRLQFRGMANDLFDTMTIFNRNNPDVFFDSAILSALIASCSFVHVKKGEDGYPQLFVISASDATGMIDETTGLLQAGYAVLERTQNGSAVTEAYFEPGRTMYYTGGDVDPIVEEHAAPVPALVPIIYRPDAVRPFGHSRISRACMSIVASALRTVKRAEISAEYYSTPQKYVTGLSDTAEFDRYRAAMSSMLAFSKDEDGDTPKLGQFAQQSMSPHTEQLRMFASLFAGETGLTLDDLGFVADNPSSSEAIRAAHENLRLSAHKAQRCFGTGFLNVGYVAACMRDDFPYLRRQLYQTRPLWEPTFEPDAATLSAIGDAIIKVNQAIPGYFTESNFRAISGIARGEEVAQNEDAMQSVLSPADLNEEEWG